MSASADDFVPTRSSAARKAAIDQFQVVTFESDEISTEAKAAPFKMKKPKGAHQAGQGEEIDLKKVRQDVINFGISGFDTAKKHEAKLAQLIRLGAKPPKRKYKNYKVLMEERKEQKKKESDRIALTKVGKTDKGRSTTQISSAKKRNSKNDVGALLKTYGKPTLKGLKKYKSKS